MTDAPGPFTIAIRARCTEALELAVDAELVRLYGPDEAYECRQSNMLLRSLGI